MSKIFISHSSTNNAAALAVANWLADSGWSEYFLDITPSRGLAPGERWQEALKSAADRGPAHHASSCLEPIGGIFKTRPMFETGGYQINPIRPRSGSAS